MQDDFVSLNLEAIHWASIMQDLGLSIPVWRPSSVPGALAPPVVEFGPFGSLPLTSAALESPDEG